jgi:hypothetical protein
MMMKSKLFTFFLFQTADAGTGTGPDYCTIQLPVRVFHNYGAARQLQIVSWLTEQHLGVRRPPNLWVRGVSCLLVLKVN